VRQKLLLGATLLLATAAVAQRETTRALGYLGIKAPPVM